MRLLSLAILLVWVTFANAQPAASYTPLNTYISPADSALAKWGRELDRRLNPPTTVSAQARPQLAGIRSRNVELLQDAVLRKHPKLLKHSESLARELVLRRAHHRGLPQLRGIMAEAMFLDRNPEWGYVRKPNATQHDVYRWVAGRPTPFNGQIKFHLRGDPAIYARDMIKDYRAPRFFIPDDHVELTKAYLKTEAMKLNAAGDHLGAAKRWRDFGRVRPMGVTSKEVHLATQQAVRRMATERYSTYVSFGASLALSLAPAAYEWAKGDLSANIAAYRAARALSLIGAGVGTDRLLARIGKGALRGGVRGNLLVGTAITVTQTVWLLHEHGWQKAFSQPSFYEETVGGISAAGLALVGGIGATALAAPTGPAAPFIGGGVAIVAGTIGYFGGKTATHALIELIAPELLLSQERERVQAVKTQIEEHIRALQTL